MIAQINYSVNGQRENFSITTSPVFLELFTQKYVIIWARKGERPNRSERKKTT